MRVAIFGSTVLALACLCAAAPLAQAAHSQTGPDLRSDPLQASPTPTPQPLSRQPDNDGLRDDDEVIKVNTQLVSIPVRVMDKRGRFIGGLAKEDFKIFEDGSEQEVALFSNEHQPFTVALVLDMSYSTTFKIAEIQNAALAFIDQLRPDDKVMVISFDEEVHMLCEATSDRNAIYRAIKSTKIATGTSLYEAVDLVMNSRLRTIDGRKAVILFTDGVDTSSQSSTDRANLNDAMELDALIYTIRYDTFADVQRMKNSTIVQRPLTISVPSTPAEKYPVPATMGLPGTQGTTPEEYRRADEYLNQLAQRTGGRLYPAATLGNLTDAYSRIASELRQFYSIGYYPNEDRVAGKQSFVKIKVDREGVVVRSREGFIRRKAQ